MSSSIWSHRDARVVIPARAIAAAGQSMAMLTLVLRVHDSGAGPFAMTALMVCLALPAVAFMGMAGRVADSADSRTVLAASGLVQVATVLALAFTTDLVLTWALVVVFTGAGSFSGPVWQALVPRIVGDEGIGKAIAWQQGLTATLAPMGAAAGGVLVGSFGGRLALLGATALLATLVIAALVVRTRRGGATDDLLAAQPKGQGARFGLGLIRHDEILAPLFVGVIVLVLVIEGINVVEVFMARDELGASPEMYGLSELFFGAGAVAGAWVAGRMATTKARAYTGAIGFGLVGVTQLVIGFMTAFWMYLVAAVVVGLTSAAANATIGALLMTRVPDQHRGKVGSALNGVVRVASMIALMLGGLAGTWLGIRMTFIVGGGLGALAAFGAWLAVRRALAHQGPTPEHRPGAT